MFDESLGLENFFGGMTAGHATVQTIHARSNSNFVHYSAAESGVDYHVSSSVRKQRLFHSCWECSNCGFLNSFIINWSNTKFIRKTDDGYSYYTKEVNCNDCNEKHLLDCCLDGRIYATNIEKLEIALPKCVSDNKYIHCIQDRYKIKNFSLQRDTYSESFAHLIYNILSKLSNLRDEMKFRFTCSNYIEVSYLLNTVEDALKRHKISNRVCDYYPTYCKLHSITNNSSLCFEYYVEDSVIKCKVEVVNKVDVSKYNYITIKELQAFHTTIMSDMINILTEGCSSDKVSEFN